MYRRLAILSLLIVIVACGAGVGVSRAAITAPFIAPGAADIQVTEVGPGERLITYRMPNPDDGWLTAVARRLSLEGWALAIDRYAWGNTEKYVSTYERSSRFWVVEIHEQTELLGDRGNALIKIHYSVALQW
jgi:hypothetical protein